MLEIKNQLILKSKLGFTNHFPSFFAENPLILYSLQRQPSSFFGLQILDSKYSPENCHEVSVLFPALGSFFVSSAFLTKKQFFLSESQDFISQLTYKIKQKFCTREGRKHKSSKLNIIIMIKAYKKKKDERHFQGINKCIHVYKFRLRQLTTQMQNALQIIFVSLLYVILSNGIT